MLHHARNTTIQRIRLLTAIGGVKPRKATGQPRMPKPLPPDAIRLEYYKAIHGQACAAPKAAFDRVRDDVLRLLQDDNRDRARNRRDSARFDAGRGGAAKKIVDQAASRAADAFRPSDLEQIANKFGNRTSDWQREQLNRQLTAAVAVPFGAIERPTRDRVPQWSAENVDLIQTVPDRYFGRIQAMVEDAFENGTDAEDLADDFVDTFDISENNATRIAYDQVGKLAGAVDADRQQALGVEKFIWRTVEDERVRESHDALDGLLCSWDEPPVDEQTGEQVIPGQPIRCRCFAEPYLADLLGGDADEYDASAPEDNE